MRKKTKCTLQAADISFILLSWIELFELLKMKKKTMLARVRRLIRISSFMGFDVYWQLSFVINVRFRHLNPSSMRFFSVL